MHIYRREATKIFQLCSAYHMCINAIAIVLIDSEFVEYRYSPFHILFIFSRS